MKQVLVVTNDQALRAALVAILTHIGIAEVIETSSAEPALSALESGVDAAFLSAALPDRLALQIAQTSSRLCPTPVVVVVSREPHPDLFALGQAGARAHLSWPATLEDVSRCLNLHPTADGLELSVRWLVGRVGIKEAQDWLRRTMLRQALEASHGSRRAAAGLLGVTRPAIQRMLREEADASGLLESAQAPPPTKAPNAAKHTPTARGSKYRRGLASFEEASCLNSIPNAGELERS